MPWLDYGGRLRKLPDGAVIIGSGADATVRVEDLDLMPRHLVIEPRAEDLQVRAYCPDVVVALRGRQVGTDACTAAYGEPIRAGSGELRVWHEQPEQSSPATPSPPRAYLISDQEQVAYPLDRLTTNIGRASGNVIRLGDPTASRFHAQVRREAGGFALHVVGSAGGAINGQRISAPTLLEEGDVVEMAHATFVFTNGPVADGIQVLPADEPGDVDAAARPTVTRDRISLSTTRPAEPPRIMRTAVVVGLVVALAAAMLALILT